MSTLAGRIGLWLTTFTIVFATGSGHPAFALNGPTMLHPGLDVRLVVDSLSAPTTFAFIGPDELLVLEKNTGRVQRVVGGEVHSTVLDLAVNFAGHRGLLGIALHPSFPADPGVYLFWSESLTGDDTNVASSTPLLGNRVDRFTWDGSSLTLDANLIRLRAPQADAGQPERADNNGGVLAFGPDGKLYVLVGDVGRRGQMQNLACGPSDNCNENDDQFGGPEPDDAHFTGVVLRLNPDGAAPDDNPFFVAGGTLGGAIGANIQKVFSYGHRNSFGMAFDPYSGLLWLQENGDDAFAELNRVAAGMNGGWVQIAGPVARIADYKAIETASADGLTQIRWPPSNIADTPSDALDALYMLPGAVYRDPELSWLWDIAPAGLGFVDGPGLGAEFAGRLFLGAATEQAEAGYLLSIPLTANRLGVAGPDVIENAAKHDLTGSEDFLIGRGFGVLTDIKTGPNGNVYVASLSHGAIYEIFAVDPGNGEPPPPPPGNGTPPPGTTPDLTVINELVVSIQNQVTTNINASAAAVNANEITNASQSTSNASNVNLSANSNSSTNVLANVNASTQGQDNQQTQGQSNDNHQRTNVRAEPDVTTGGAGATGGAAAAQSGPASASGSGAGTSGSGSGTQSTTPRIVPPSTGSGGLAKDLP